MYTQFFYCFGFICQQRYQVNQFNEGDRDYGEDDSGYTYYVRPFVPFWSLQSLQFEDINKHDKVPAQRDKTYPRYLMEKLVKTWLRRDKQWFDQKEIFEILKEDIAAMLDSKSPPKKNLRKKNTKKTINSYILISDVVCESNFGGSHRVRPFSF